VSGETLSIVGESGCGKTTLANLLLRIEVPTSGVVLFDNEDVRFLRGRKLARFRATVQAVFQDPYSSLNPRMRVRDIIAEPLRVSGQKLAADTVSARVRELLLELRLDPTLGRAYPHELSGGQRQRVAVARAIASNPLILILDEPVSALDVSIAAQLMNLLKELQERLGMSYLLIAHNLAAVRYLSHSVSVMYMGQIVESAASEEIFMRPLHPYTKALMSASRQVRPGEGVQEMLLGGEVEPPIGPPLDCRFRARCPFAFDRCAREMPELREIAPGHKVACHLY
jgi:oligopeptide/dipeptide ABC transporter ATP-binding protein